jgi:hypothetical protein
VDNGDVTSFTLSAPPNDFLPELYMARDTLYSKGWSSMLTRYGKHSAHFRMSRMFVYQFPSGLLVERTLAAQRTCGA